MKSNCKCQDLIRELQRKCSCLVFKNQIESDGLVRMDGWFRGRKPGCLSHFCGMESMGRLFKYHEENGRWNTSQFDGFWGIDSQ